MDGEWVDLEPLGTEGQYSDFYDVDTYSKFGIAIPFGLGVRYKLNQNFDIEFEILIIQIYSIGGKINLEVVNNYDMDIEAAPNDNADCSPYCESWMVVRKGEQIGNWKVIADYLTTPDSIGIFITHRSNVLCSSFFAADRFTSNEIITVDESDPKNPELIIFNNPCI